MNAGGNVRYSVEILGEHDLIRQIAEAHFAFSMTVEPLPIGEFDVRAACYNNGSVLNHPPYGFVCEVNGNADAIDVEFHPVGDNINCNACTCSHCLFEKGIDAKAGLLRWARATVISKATAQIDRLADIYLRSAVTIEAEAIKSSVARNARKC